MTAPYAVLEEVPPARRTEGPGPGRGRRRIGGPIAPVEIRDLSKHFGAVAAVSHLSAITGNHPFHRVEEVLSAVGLSDAADHPVKGYSMGMRQRLAIAAALLGDPQVLILDEPNNGLHPPGIIWLRDLIREQAADGRAVLISSHVLAEVAQSVDDIVVIAEGELRAHGSLEQVLGGDDGPATTVRAQDPVRLSGALERRGHRIDRDGDVLNVLGATPEEVGKIAGDEQLAVLGLAPRTRSLEEAFIALTGVQS